MKKLSSLFLTSSLIVLASCGETIQSQTQDESAPSDISSTPTAEQSSLSIEEPSSTESSSATNEKTYTISQYLDESLMSKEMQRTILDDFFNKEKDHHANIYPDTVGYLNKYCGEYNGAYVMFVEFSFMYYADAVIDENIAGHQFVFNSSHTLDVYKEHKFYSIETAYEQHILSDEDIDRIHARYTNRPEYLDGMTFDDTLFEDKYVTLGVDDTYYLPISCTKEDYFWIEVKSEDKSIAAYDLENNIVGKSIGNTTVYVLVDEEFYDTIEVHVMSDDYMKQYCKLNKEYIYGKSFTVFGDSISDNSVTAYPENKPTFWSERLEKQYNMTGYNYASSGGTCGYTRKLVERVGFQDHLMITFQIDNKKAIEAVKQSDYVFIFIGTNDATYGANLGNYNDVNDDNKRTTESFRGSYTYVIQKIRELNPKAKIISIGVTYTTWQASANPTDAPANYTYAKTKEEMDGVVQDIAAYNKIKYVHTYDLWDASTWQQCVPDGIHPQNKGYELLVKRIVDEI